MSAIFSPRSSSPPPPRRRLAKSDLKAILLLELPILISSLYSFVTWESPFQQEIEPATSATITHTFDLSEYLTALKCGTIFGFKGFPFFLVYLMHT